MIINFINVYLQQLVMNTIKMNNIIKLFSIIVLLLTTLFLISCGKNNTKNNMEENNMNTMIMLETTNGNIKIELFTSTMPITAGNFLKLVNDGFYDGVIFHRVIPNFMIQGGDPTGTGMGGPGYTIKDEFTNNNKNNIGTLSMANAGPNTGGSQFFINTANNNFLDTKHPVFGKVVEGMDVVDAISKVQKNSQDKPLTNVVINTAYVVE